MHPLVKKFIQNLTSFPSRLSGGSRVRLLLVTELLPVHLFTQAVNYELRLFACETLLNYCTKNNNGQRLNKSKVLFLF